MSLFLSKVWGGGGGGGFEVLVAEVILDSAS